jgi:hypothetical protein
MSPYRQITSKSRALKARDFDPRTFQNLWLSGVIRTLGLALLIALSAPLLNSQRPPTNPTPPQEPKPPVFINSKAPDYSQPTPRPLTFEEVQYRRYIAERLKSMASDTEKLLKLTREINAKIDKSGTGSLSREDLRTLAEIEKLAHNVKWKMQLAAEGSRTQ